MYMAREWPEMIIKLPNAKVVTFIYEQTIITNSRLYSVISNREKISRRPIENSSSRLVDTGKCYRERLAQCLVLRDMIKVQPLLLSNAVLKTF